MKMDIEFTKIEKAFGKTLIKVFIDANLRIKTQLISLPLDTIYYDLNVDVNEVNQILKIYRKHQLIKSFSEETNDRMTVWKIFITSSQINSLFKIIVGKNALTMNQKKLQRRIDYISSGFIKQEKIVENIKKTFSKRQYYRIVCPICGCLKYEFSKINDLLENNNKKFKCKYGHYGVFELNFDNDSISIETNGGPSDIQEMLREHAQKQRFDKRNDV